MKNKKGISLPHPVIGLGDDVDGEFNIGLQIVVKNQEFIIDEISVDINNDYFKSLFANKIITTAYKILCSSTLYSNTITGKINLKIPSAELSNTVLIECFLIANENIEKYTDVSFNPDSALGANKGVFKIAKGAIVGIAGSYKIELNSAYVNGLVGIINFNPTSIDQPISIDTSDNSVIIVNYPKKDDDADMVNLLSQKSSKFKNTFFNLFLIPALTNAFKELIIADKENRFDDFIESYQWASIINSQSDDWHNDDDPYELAQLFLKKVVEDKSKIAQAIPIVSAFNELKTQ